MRRARLLALALSLPVLGAGSAPPTDIELRAAYCVGRLNGPPLDVNAYPEQFRKEIQAGEEARLNTLRRLRSYVMPKVDHLDTNAMVAAIEQGKAARRRTGQTAEACGDNMTAECQRDWDDLNDCRKAAFLPF